MLNTTSNNLWSHNDKYPTYLYVGKKSHETKITHTVKCLTTLFEIYPYVFCIHVYLQLRYISAMDEPVLRPKFMTRSRL